MSIAGERPGVRALYGVLTPTYLQEMIMECAHGHNVHHCPAHPLRFDVVYDEPSGYAVWDYAENEPTRYRFPFGQLDRAEAKRDTLNAMDADLRNANLI